MPETRNVSPMGTVKYHKSQKRGRFAETGTRKVAGKDKENVQSLGRNEEGLVKPMKKAAGTRKVPDLKKNILNGLDLQ